MSSLSEADFKSLRLIDDLQISAAVLFLYDSAITVGDEMRSIWGRKLTGAIVLFYLNKHLFILRTALLFAGYLKFSDEVCATLVKVSFVFELLPYLVWGFFTALRTYALCRNKFLFSIIVLLSGVPVGINLARLLRGVSGSYLPLFGCINEDPSTVAETKTGTTAIISRTSLILVNCIAIGTTWTTMRRGFRYFEPSGKRTIAGVLLWDGLAYFLVLAVLDALHMILTLISLFNFNDNSSLVTSFTDPVTAILVSRFILNLQAADSRLLAGTVSSSQELTRRSDNPESLVFERVIGSLGASINMMDDYAIEEYHDEDNAVEGGTRVEGVPSADSGEQGRVQ